MFRTHESPLTFHNMTSQDLVVVVVLVVVLVLLALVMIVIFDNVSHCGGGGPSLYLNIGSSIACFFWSIPNSKKGFTESKYPNTVRLK